MPPLGDMKGGISQDHVGVFVPALLAGEGVVFEDVRVDKVVQVHVDQRETYHVGRDVVAFDVGCQSCFFVGRERTVSMVIGVVRKNVFVGGDEESGGAASRVEQRFVLLGIDDGDDEVDDMAWGSELSRVALGTEDGEQVLESVSQTLRVVVAELVDDIEEGPQRLRVTIGQVDVLRRCRGRAEGCPDSAASRQWPRHRD